MFEICCKKDFSLDFLKRIEKYSVIIIPQKLKGFFKKAELSLSFGAFACDYSKSLVRDPHSFKKALSVFQNYHQRSVKTKPSLTLIPYIDLSWACDPGLRAFDML
ncbi:hypothetical protein HMPREF1451_00690 [Helicobacter pylori HP260BFii]|nr:hypothetical protein HMPREF1451_00690 [Helicobacter pylori HP260BFii]